jgi:hypothetical protein
MFLLLPQFSLAILQLLCRFFAVILLATLPFGLKRMGCRLTCTEASPLTSLVLALSWAPSASVVVLMHSS